jgi:hypothetical protein
MFDYRLSDFIRFLERAARAVNGGLRRYEKVIKMLRQCERGPCAQNTALPEEGRALPQRVTGQEVAAEQILSETCL